MIHVVSMSGGKDSVALWLWARRTGLNPVAVYIDTGWEWTGHAVHLDLLEERIGTLVRLLPKTSFADQVRRKKSFPSRVRKWCTEELKLKPFRDWLDVLRAERKDDATVLLGLRRQESAARAKLAEREWSDFYDCEVWRPLLDWSVADVAAEHHRAGVPLHPLYHAGAERVGCWPCVNASKRELALVAEMAPERIAEIRALEAEMGVTMFTRDRRAEKARTGGPSVEPVGIDDVVSWARTTRGGSQFALFQPPMGCARWGVCDAPGADPERKP